MSVRWLAVLWLLLTPMVATAVQDGPGDAMPEDGDSEETGTDEESPSEDGVEGAAEIGDDEAEDASDSPAEDPFEAGLRRLVTRYYTEIGTTASERDLAEGVQSIKLMLMDGVSLDRIEAAVSDAITLHTPGRRVPFPVAVPLRVKPAGTPPARAPEPTASAARPPASSSTTGSSSGSGTTSSGSTESAERAGTVIEERWVKRQEELRARRNRLRLYLQWRDRTRDKRILLGVGIPLFAAGWAGTWALAGGALTLGATPPSIGWTGAIPVVGPFIFGAATAPDFPPAFVFGGFQGIGLALTVIGLAQKHDLPYDRDPTAMRIGRDPKTGRAIMTIRPMPLGFGGGFSGTF